MQHLHNRKATTNTEKNTHNTPVKVWAEGAIERVFEKGHHTGLCVSSMYHVQYFQMFNISHHYGLQF